MMLTTRRSFDLFDEFFNDPFFNPRKPVARLMKTDVRELDNSYVLDIDLPGYDKNNIRIELKDGYVTVKASLEKESDDSGNSRYLRRERFCGECSRSFYVGEKFTKDDIKASFRNGILSLEFPKEAPEEIPEPDYIEIGD